MSRVPDDKLKPVAAMLGANGVDWAIGELRQYKKLIGHWAGHDNNNELEQTLFACALDLRDRLPMFVKTYELVGEECPLCIDPLE